MVNNLGYYRRFTDSHNKISFKILRSKYGWSGEGKFWALVDIIADCEDCKLDLSKLAIKATIADELDFTLDEFSDYIAYLSDTDGCALLTNFNEVYTFEDLKETLHTVSSQRERARNSAREKRANAKNISETKQEFSETSEKFSEKTDEFSAKVNKIKENKTKLNEINKNIINTQFEDWYKKYPHKKGKQKASEHFAIIIKSGKYSLDQLNLAVKNLNIEVAEKFKTDPKFKIDFVPYASTFLGPQKKYLDYLEAQPRASPSEPERQYNTVVYDELAGRPVDPKKGW